MLQMTYQVLASDWSYHCHLHWNWCYAVNINNILYILSIKESLQYTRYMYLAVLSSFVFPEQIPVVNDLYNHFSTSVTVKSLSSIKHYTNCSDALNLSIQSNLSNMKLSGPKKKKVSVIKVSGLEGFCNALKVETEF